MSLEVGKTCGKRHRKSAENTFPRLGRLENSENRLSQPWENQKTEENGRPNLGKTRNQRKSAFPHEGKQEISEKRISLTGENKKTTKLSFPTRGKVKKC